MERERFLREYPVLVVASKKLKIISIVAAFTR